jgi:hypothetical protein
VNDLAVKQIRNGRKTDMRMRPHIDTLPRRKVGGPHVIEEHERANRPLRWRGQHAPDGEAAKIARWASMAVAIGEVSAPCAQTGSTLGQTLMLSSHSPTPIARRVASIYRAISPSRPAW